ncbi:transposase for insertion sequence element IS256 in transposon Tn4001 [Oceanobacillus indicireducens]|uniref:Mutator family transposase n=1 Tax=Oceanobacillus indicireducens TaxID=1004261 RepID=A0A917Y590_9BACI|nr:IS256 family transposase [Oceanobacillus indicireducens]GGN66964.1 transposase for insertion sequence element IS256 in transposon Tn4001 [Oceanobacillus indicireducens]
MAHIQFNLNFDELKEKILTSNLDDILKSTMVLVLNEYMKQEQTDYLNAQSYERSSDRRDYRNGYYERELLMSIGNVPLRVPRTHSGEFHTSALKKYERSDQSFLLALVEMVVNGVSTRKVTNVVNKLCGENVSKSFVSSLTKKLDPVVEEWANRSLSEIYYPYVFVDAMYVKVREYNRVVSKAIYIATAIDDNGKRHVLGFDVDHEESYEAWKDFLHRLKQRGLQAPRLVISDAHSGLKKAIQRVFVGTAWQRCTVHFKRNVIDKMPKKGIQEVKNDFKRIYNGSSTQEARNIKNEFIEKYKDQPKLEKAIHTLEEGFEDTIQYLVEPLNIINLYALPTS